MPAKFSNGYQRRILILGAGGPLGAVLARELSTIYELRLGDVRPIERILKNSRPQSSGAPLPQQLVAPHEWRVVDVRNLESVISAAREIDVIVNLSVHRTAPVDAYSVNALGMLNIMRAASVNNVARVIQTGPYQLDPAHPYAKLFKNNAYFHSKLLGEQIARTFAETYRIKTLALRFGAIKMPQLQVRSNMVKRLAKAKNAFLRAMRLSKKLPPELYQFTVTWPDAAKAIKCAIQTETASDYYSEYNITTQSVEGLFSNLTAREVLGWR